MAKQRFSAYIKQAPKSFDYKLDPPDDEPEFSEEEKSAALRWCDESDYETMQG